MSQILSLQALSEFSDSQKFMACTVALIIAVSALTVACAYRFFAS